MRELVSAKKKLHPIGIVGAGRSRGGLGPFLAQFFEDEGFFVSGVSGRSLERATVNAEMLGQQLGHEITPFPSARELCASGVTALVIASPVQFHLEALQAAAETGVPTLCEKPLVHEKQAKQGAEAISTFGRKCVPLLENCQWPYTLSAFFQLHGPVEAGDQLRVEMGLGPPQHGLEMVQNTVSHVLSVIQAVAPINSGAVVTEVCVSDPTYTKAENLLQFRLMGEVTSIEGLLHMKVCPSPPRPAWLSINGCRMDRHVQPGYAIAFSGNSREVTIEDPTRKLVRHFARLVRSRDCSLLDHDRDQIAQRLEWYRQILNRLE
jgi:hypothetical protein